MTDRPIIFSAPMVRALLDGRKTQTRRVLTPHTARFSTASREYWDHANFEAAYADGEADSGMYLHVPCHSDEDASGRGTGCDCRLCDEMGWTTTVHRLWPKVEVGDRLWVRESGHEVRHADYHNPISGEDEWCVHGFKHAADGFIVNWNGNDPSAYIDDCSLRSRPSIHMPRWASRLTLIVEGVKVERLQDISEADAVEESALLEYGDGARISARRAFELIWKPLLGEDAWNKNQWVAAVSFRVVKANIEAMESANV